MPYPIDLAVGASDLADEDEERLVGLQRDERADLIGHACAPVLTALRARRAARNHTEKKDEMQHIRPLQEWAAPAGFTFYGISSTNV